MLQRARQRAAKMRPVRCSPDTQPGGADMNRMTDETMALSVTEATMQDWLAAMTLLREAPPPVAGPRTVLWPEDTLTSTRRVAPVTTRRRVAPAPARPDRAPLRVAGAGTAYWWLLALALAAALVI
jgi:hypothetical protein